MVLEWHMMRMTICNCRYNLGTLGASSYVTCKSAPRITRGSSNYQLKMNDVGRLVGKGRGSSDYEYYVTLYILTSVVGEGSISTLITDRDLYAQSHHLADNPILVNSSRYFLILQHAL